MRSQKDPIGDRMKGQYEDRTRYLLPRRTFTIIRLDGKAFHTLTKNLERPFDSQFCDLMDHVAKECLRQIECAQFAYVQSDEISLLLTDFTNQDTQAWFDSNLQKMCSVSASIATAAFNNKKTFSTIVELGLFDSRVFTIPDRNEVSNYFLWRTRDAIRNSILAVGQSYFKDEMHGMSTAQVQDRLLAAHGVNWNNFSPRFKTGALFTKDGPVEIPITGLFDFYLNFIPQYP